MRTDPANFGSFQFASDSPNHQRVAAIYNHGGGALCSDVISLHLKDTDGGYGLGNEIFTVSNHCVIASAVWHGETTLDVRCVSNGYSACVSRPTFRWRNVTVRVQYK